MFPEAYKMDLNTGSYSHFNKAALFLKKDKKCWKWSMNLFYITSSHWAKIYNDSDFELWCICDMLYRIEKDVIEVIDLLEETESDNLNTTENKRDPFSDVFNVAADAQDADEEIDGYKKLPSCVRKDDVRMISDTDTDRYIER